MTLQYSSLHPAGRYGLKVAAEHLFNRGKDGQPHCLFVSNGCAIPAHLYSGNDFKPAEFPSPDNHVPFVPFPVHQALLRLYLDDNSKSRQMMLGLGRRTQEERYVNHHPPIGSAPAKKAAMLRYYLKQASLDLLLADAELV